MLIFIKKLDKSVMLLTTVWLIFCCMVFLWFFRYYRGETYDESFAELTAIILLLGWTLPIDFLGGVHKSLGIFLLVVKSIITKDMFGFMLIFVFILIGFSFAMHMLRVPACPSSGFIHLHETFFSVLSSAFGIGDFMEATITNPECTGAATDYLFELVYFGYVCVTMIVLLNLLIAIMNHRYEKTRRIAKNMWRFHILSIMENRKYIVQLIKASNMLYLWKLPRFKDSIGSYIDESESKLIFDEDLNRWYLKLMLPVGKQIEEA